MQAKKVCLLRTQVQGTLDSNRNEMAKLQTDMQSMRKSLAGATNMQEVQDLLLADAMYKMSVIPATNDQGRPRVGLDIGVAEVAGVAEKHMERAARQSDDAMPMQDV